MYAVIATGGKQYKVEEDQFLRVEKLEGEVGDILTIAEVLAICGESGIVAGADVSNASVEAEIMEQGRAKKIIVYKYKRKTGYHKKRGHRQYYTKIRIKSIKSES